MYPEKIAGWVMTDSSKSTATPGRHYENPEGTREFVIIGYKRVRDPDTYKVEDRIPYFKYNPHTEPGERIEVKGFETIKESAQFGIDWMINNPVSDKDMGDKSTGLMAFTQNSSTEENETQEPELEDNEEEEKETPVIQHNPMVLLEEYSPDGEYVGKSPVAKGHTRPGEMPSKDEWPDGWLDKTDEIEHYQEGREGNKINRKRVVCDCGLSIDCTGTALSITCHSCGRSLIDMKPADSPGGAMDEELSNSPSNNKKSGEHLTRTDSNSSDDDDEENEEKSGLQSFVDNNS